MTTRNTRRHNQKKREDALAMADHLTPPPPKRVDQRVLVVQSSLPSSSVCRNSPRPVTAGLQVSYNIDF